MFNEGESVNSIDNIVDWEPGLSDAEFVEQHVLNHQSVELDEQQLGFFTEERIKFESEEGGEITFEFGDIVFRCTYNKFKYAFREGQVEDSLTARERIISLELSNFSLSEEELDDLYVIETASITSKENGEQVDLLKDAKFLAIIFQGTENNKSSNFSVMSKVLFIRSNLTSVSGIMKLIHEIGHEVTLRNIEKKKEAMPAIHAVQSKKPKRQNINHHIRVYAQAEIDAYNYVYQAINSISQDQELLSVSKQYLLSRLSTHINKLKKVYKKTHPEE